MKPRVSPRPASLFSLSSIALAALSVLSASSTVTYAAPAASSKTSTAPSSGGSSVGAFHIIGADDTLSITVQRHPEFSVDRVIVSDNGLINVPVAGSVRAAGKTAAQLDAELTRRFKKRLLRPEVIVSIVTSAPRPIYVVGEVRAPGVLAFRNGWRITQALAAAGGLSVDSGMAAVTVSRGKSVIADVPLLSILRNPSNPQNLQLRVGDTLRFYERVVKVNISGAVKSPGVYSVPRGNGVVEAIGLAGGPTVTAFLTRATLKRSNGTTVPINLYEALRLGNAGQNVALREGDVLSIPEFTDRVAVLGAVKTPGNYPLEDGRSTRIADVIARAGGVAPGAALTRATLQRGNGQIMQLDLYRLLVLGEKDKNFALSANDVLTIPESRGITVIGAVQNAGTYKIEEGQSPRALEAIAQAGGPTLNAEDSRVSISRTVDGKNVTLSLDPVGLFQLSQPEQNPLLQDGDIISISAIKTSTVTINGFVKTPGTYQVKEGAGLASLIAQAGGEIEGASLSLVAVRSRGGEARIVNVVSLLAGGTGTDVVLRDGDTVTVPRNENRILVAGAVNRPNTYALPEGRVLTIADALGLAGGAQGGAGAKQIVLWRKTAQGGFQETKLRTDKAVDGRLAFNEPVQKDDVILVPEAKTSGGTLGLINRFLPALSFFIR